MNERIQALLAKLVENKTTLIKIGSTVLGGLIGLGVTHLLTQEVNTTEDDLVKAVLSEEE